MLALMIYEKPPKNVEEQVALLLNRGLIAERETLRSTLTFLNYYRLTGYLHPFRIRDTNGVLLDRYNADTTLDEVLERYEFDRKLRLIIMDAVERIEVAVRTRLGYNFVHVHGPFGHLDSKNLPGFDSFSSNIDHARWLAKLKTEYDRSKESFVRHFKDKYGDSHKYLPLWMACELMTCESILQFACAVEPAILKASAADFSFPDQQLRSWTKSIFSLRNACAHHARVWNKIFGLAPSLPSKNKNPKWHTVPSFTNNRIGILLTIAYFWLQQIGSAEHWKRQLFSLFHSYPNIPTQMMGLPENWQNHPLWQSTTPPFQS